MSTSAEQWAAEVAERQDDERIFTGYHFRTSSRFGSHVEVRVDDDWVTVTGRRVRKPVRDVWIAAQGVLMAVTFGWLIEAICGGGRRAWGRVAFWAFVEYLVAALGALFLWWPADRGEDGIVWLVTKPEDRAAAEVEARASYSTLRFPRSSVSNVAHTRDYSRHGLWLVSWPWQLVQLLPPGGVKEVVFDVDDPERPGETLVFAISVDSPETAAELAELLAQ